MHRFYFQRLGLCDEQGEAASTASGDPAAPLTIGQKLAAALSSKQSLASQISAHEATIASHVETITARDATIADLTSKLATANAKIATLEADASAVSAALAAHETEITQLKAAEKSAEQKANEKVAALGFPAAKLPAASEDAEPKKLSRSALDALDAASQEAFFRAGGKVLN